MSRSSGSAREHAGRVASQHAAADCVASQHAVAIRLFFANVGQTKDMWTGKNALQHAGRFARTVEHLMIDYKADVLWLCEVGHHTDGLRGSQLIPKGVLLESAEAPRLMAIKDQLHETSSLT